MTEAVSPISRRELLTPWQAPERTDQRLAGAIERELGLTPNQVEFHMVAGNHVLTPEHVARIEKDGIDVITGELKSEVLNLYALQSLGQPDSSENSLSLKDILYRLEHLGEGASPSEMRYHRETIKSLLRQGKTFVSADAMDPYQSSFDSDKPISLYSIAEGGLIAALIGPEVLYVGRKLVEKRNKSTNAEQKDSKDGVTRRSLLQWGALELGIYLAKKHIDYVKNGADIPLLDATSSIDPFALQSGYEELREKLGIDKHAFEVYSKELVAVRNKVMALNTWHTIATAAKPDQKTAIMMMFGSGHIKTYDDFLLGPEALEKEIESYARKICTDSLNFLIKEADEEKKDTKGLNGEAKIVTDLAEYASMFVDPYFYGRNGPLDESKVPRMPKTARTVFIQTLSEVISENEKIDTQEGQRKVRVLKDVRKAIIAELTYEFNQNRQANDQLKGKADISISKVNEGKRNEIVSSFTSDFSDSTSEAEAEIGKSKGDKIVFAKGLDYIRGLQLGVALFSGMYRPLTRTFTHLPDSTIKTEDSLNLSSGHRISLGSSMYKRLQAVYNKADLFTKNLIHVLYVDTNPVYPYYAEMHVHENIGPLQGFPKEAKEENQLYNRDIVYYAKIEDGKDDLLTTDLLLWGVVNWKN